MQGSNAIVTEQMPRGGWEVALKSPHQEQPNPGMQITQSQAGVKVKTKIQWEEADPSGHGRHWVGGIAMPSLLMRRYLSGQQGSPSSWHRQ